ncbi:alpha/beta hydrolase family protein [Clostridium sp.]|uniref:alpha/beta hydrolase n=1 Tax=Clostridium sp. TaxID=1506 RepID=UPI001A50147B|nr:alpha/beta hydrolase family protein [Clostridium sp.]MBK5236888.1 esterase family protein [Clostridium sp.]
MALIHCDFFSETLEISTSMSVIIPENTRKQIGMKGNIIKPDHPTLYLFHGLSDDHTIWERRTSIERYAANLGIAVVMPAANRSFYTDMKYGERYWTFISDELPEVCRNFFHLSSTREDNFVAGISMGGYGAFKLALRCPDKFAAAASISGVLDLSALVENKTGPFKRDFNNIFGENTSTKDTKDDLFYLAQKVARSNNPKPKLFQCCGMEDTLYEGNIKFRNFCRKLPLDLTYEDQHGNHEWGYWDTQIQKVLKWLPLC